MRIVKVRALKYALITGFLFSLHLALVSYANSTFAASLFGENAVGPLFSIASLLALIALLFWAPRKIAINGSVLFVALLLLISVFALTGLSQATFGIIAAALFVLYLSHNSLILYGFDMIVEHATENADTGKIRGIYLTVLNFAWMVALLATGRIIEYGGFRLLYLVGATLVFFSLATLYRARHMLNTHKMKPVRVGVNFRHMIRSKNLSSIFLVNFLLQSFYVIMVIFTPLYLSTIVGFGWKEISIIFVAMLSPFVLLQYPLGRIADMRFGEKEILIFGLIVMGLATLMITTIDTPSVWLWATTLLATRVGAASVEVMSDSYFFKHVDEKDSGLVSIYRAIAPFAGVIMPMLGALIISAYSYTALFSFLGVLCLLAIIPAVRIKDTK
ncbi:MAG TPA: MFS transporter [Candidatus Paceibacterota bacterium]|nr:MFS transporter [Candidatus Paceibacterota bacterium]